jgi:hypothetical protein
MCGKQGPVAATFCSSCGSKHPDPTQPPPPSTDSRQSRPVVESVSVSRAASDISSRPYRISKGAIIFCIVASAFMLSVASGTIASTEDVDSANMCARAVETRQSVYSRGYGWVCTIQSIREYRVTVLAVAALALLALAIWKLIGKAWPTWLEGASPLVFVYSMFAAGMYITVDGTGGLWLGWDPASPGVSPAFGYALLVGMWITAATLLMSNENPAIPAKSP